MSGRKKSSVAALKAAGNKAHKTKKEIEERKNSEEKLKELPKDKIRPPTWLNTQSKKIFKSIVKELAAVDLLANIDVFPLAVLADAFEKYIRVTTMLDEADIMVKFTNKSGATNTVENPLVRTQIKYAELIKKYSNEFGLTVASRLKVISVNSNSGPGDDFDDDF